MRPSAAHHTNTITRSEAGAQLAMLLVNCTDERLAGFTVEALERMYRVRAAEIGELLAAERERRAYSARQARCHG